MLRMRVLSMRQGGIPIHVPLDRHDVRYAELSLLHGRYRAVQRRQWHLAVLSSLSRSIGIRLFLGTMVGLMVSACAAPPVREGFVSCWRLGRMSECITVPLADQSADVEAKQFMVPSNGKARLYLVRPYTQEPRRRTDFFIDGQRVAELAPMTYLVLDVLPGKHRLKVRTSDETTTLDIDVNENYIYYVQHQFDLLFNTTSARLKVVQEGDAQPRILASRRAIAFTRQEN